MDKKTEIGEIDDVLSEDYPEKKINTYKILRSEQKQRGRDFLNSTKLYLDMSGKIGGFKERIHMIRFQKDNRDKEVQDALNTMARLGSFLTSEERLIGLTPDTTLTRLCTNLMHQLTSLSGHCTTEQLERLEAGLTNLESVFKGVCVTMAEDMARAASRVSEIRPSSREQQNAVRDSGGSVQEAASSAPGSFRPSAPHGADILKNLSQIRGRNSKALHSTSDNDMVYDGSENPGGQNGEKTFWWDSM